MRKIVDKISQRLSLTPTEVITLIFVFIVFVTGLVLNKFEFKQIEPPIRKFDYSFEDSLFKALNSGKYKQIESLKIIEKRVDSEQELSDFSTKKKDSKKNNSLTLKESSINLNTADVDILTKLPGIGSKTAQKIIKLRNEKKRFKSIRELTEVKGIGLKKFEKIKNFVYIDK